MQRPTYLPVACLAAFFVMLSSPVLLAQDKPNGPPKPQVTGQPPEMDPDRSGVDLERLNGLKGFRGIDFGSSFDAVSSEMELYQDRGPLQVYTRKGEELLMGPVLLNSVHYHFFNGQFYAAVLNTVNSEDFEMLGSVFRFAFGPGELDQDGSSFWIGKNNGAILKRTPTGGAVGVLFNMKLHEEYLQYADKAAKEVADKL